MNNPRCLEYRQDKYRTLAIASASMGAVSLVASLAVILFILILKKYHNFVQRLILYLSIAIAINAVSLTLRYIRISDKDHRQGHLEYVCIVAGFLYQTTRWSMTIAYACLTFSLLMAAVFMAHGERYEKIYFVGIFLFPLLFNWIPFIRKMYGEAGPWCWIRSNDYEYDLEGNVINCSTNDLGWAMRLALWYVPHYATLLILLAAYLAVVIALFRKSRYWRGTYTTLAKTTSDDRQELKQLVTTIILYPLVLFILNIFPLVNRLNNQPNYILWLLHAIFSPLQGGFVAVVYVLDIETIKRLRSKNCLVHLMPSRARVKEYPASSGVTDSLYQQQSPDQQANYGSMLETQHPGHRLNDDNSGGMESNFSQDEDCKKLEPRFQQESDQ